MTNKINGKQFVHHGGSLPGFKPVYIRYVEEKTPVDKIRTIKELPDNDKTAGQINLKANFYSSFNIPKVFALSSTHFEEKLVSTPDNR